MYKVNRRDMVERERFGLVWLGFMAYQPLLVI